MLLLGTKQPQPIERGRGKRLGKMGGSSAVGVGRRACRNAKNPFCGPGDVREKRQLAPRDQEPGRPKRP